MSTQLGFDFRSPPLQSADELLARLQQYGLRSCTVCSITRNRTVMVSFKAGALRVHAGYLHAPEEVLRGIVRFVDGPSRRDRALGRAVLLGYKIPDEAPRRRRREVQHPDDAAMAETLITWHAKLNAERFGGTLTNVAIKVSRRLHRRLGHYAAGTPAGDAPEIVISRRHIRRHGWKDALDTLLHEMVHQWQDEAGYPLDHGPAFRRKAREVGITPRATRTDLPRAPRLG